MTDSARPNAQAPGGAGAAGIGGAQALSPVLTRLFRFAVHERERLVLEARVNEAARRVAPETVRQLAELGAFSLLVPREFSGAEAEPQGFVKLLEELARGDAATAWCVMTGATTGLLSAYMPAAGAREIWRPGAVTAGVFAPLGRAERAPGGYRVSGRWPFASGSENASWWMGGARLAAEAGGRPELLNVFFPCGEGVRHDTWSTLGLRGTGSHDIELVDCFIPEAQVARVLGHEPSYVRPIYAFPLFGLLSAGVAAVALGIGRAAIDALTEQLQGKLLPGGKRASSQGHLQLEVGRAEMELRAGRALLFTTCAELYEEACERAALSGQTQLWPDAVAAGAKPAGFSSEQRALLRLAALGAVRGAVRAVDAVYEAAGGSALYTRAPFERHFRDIHTLTQHVMVQPGAHRLVGAVLLGEEVDTAQL